MKRVYEWHVKTWADDHAQSIEDARKNVLLIKITLIQFIGNMQNEVW